MYPCNESRAGPGNELAPQAFPCAEPPRAVFSSPGCSGQESQNGTAHTTSTTNAVMPPWNSTTSSSVGSWFRSAGAVGKDISIEQIQDELEGFRYSEFSSQQKTAYMRGDSGFTNIFPAINENSCSGQKSFYPCRGLILNGDENSETLKLHDIGSSSWNPETLGLIQEPAASPQTASNFYYDTGVKSRIETTTSFLPQGNLIQTAVTNPVSTDNMDLFQGMEATEDNETHIFMCPEEKIFIPRSDDNSCPNHDKGKIVQDSLWDSNWTAEHHHLKDYHFGGNKSSVQNVSESAVISTNLLKFFCPEYTVGCHHVVSYPYPCLDVKELEEKEWTKLLQKELTNSDVGSLGRIVLPKKEAEANLPALLERDGLVLEMVDMANHVVWGFKYRFWPNNRSRMYILENTGDFAKMNKLEIGDSLVIYGDTTSRYYLVGVEKKATREKMIRGNGVIDQPRDKVRSSERQRR